MLSPLATLAGCALLLPLQALSAVLTVHLFMTGDDFEVNDGGFHQMAHQALVELNARPDTNIEFTMDGWVSSKEGENTDLTKLDKYLSTEE